jgi:endoglucanase
VEQADGFALNVANFETTETSVTYGTQLSDALAGKHFVIDTSRNGAGPPPADAADTKQGHPTWCNPETARLGASPTSDTGVPRLDAMLWVKQPGDSDGECRGAPPAGTWWPSYALQLVG